MNKTGQYILAIVIIAAVGWLLWYLQSIVVYIIISALISLIGSPLVSLLSKIKIKKRQLPRSAAAGITLIVIWALIFGFFSFTIPLIIKQANEFSKIDVNAVMDNMQKPLLSIEEFVQKMSPEGENFSIKEYAIQKVVPLLSITHVTDFFTATAGVLGDIFIAIFSISFISFFVMKEERLLRNIFVLFIPQKYEAGVIHVMESINYLLVRYFIGITVEVFLVFLLNSIGLSIVGIKLNHALTIALIAGFLNVIPYLGPLMGAAIGLLIGFVTHLHYDFITELLPLLGFMGIVFLSVQMIDNILFQPLIYSSSVNAHPLEIFLIILIAGSLAGIPGMVLAIPTYTILRVIAKEFFHKFRVIKKLTAKM